ncbi:hypothetical protein L9F63_008946 [Diploptera punctata]|uniref:Uncharacterized protein n=1 Tax=Diploptera punctata TaxID=6984 RepID=A0AAD7Z4K1_DIPPU|nr:hypothetical protein L9F63_008946 [Diploptera punctata]
MVEYTFAEYTDMALVYGVAEGNGRAARQLYQERCSQRMIPFLSELHDGSENEVSSPSTERTVVLQKCAVPPKCKTLYCITLNSTRTMARAMDVSNGIMCEVLHDHVPSGDLMTPYTAYPVAKQHRQIRHILML